MLTYDKIITAIPYFEALINRAQPLTAELTWASEECRGVCYKPNGWNKYPIDGKCSSIFSPILLH